MKYVIVIIIIIVVDDVLLFSECSITLFSFIKM